MKLIIFENLDNDVLCLNHQTQWIEQSVLLPKRVVIVQYDHVMDGDGLFSKYLEVSISQLNLLLLFI